MEAVLAGDDRFIPVPFDQPPQDFLRASIGIDLIGRIEEIATRVAKRAIDRPSLLLGSTPLFGPEGHGSQAKLRYPQTGTAE
ncbi:hypothetical protein D3C84_1051790 [compost metagenome]